jgi:hypothetical protein
MRMNLMAVIFGLFLSCGPAQDAPRPDAINPRGAEGFCEVMAKPKLFLDKPITLRAVALVLYGGVLLKSDECKAPEVTLHYRYGYEKGSDARALEALERFKHKARDAHMRGDGVKAEQTVVGVVLEGRLDKNPYYRLKIPRGDKTLAAWDYHYEYAFVVTRVVSLRQLP